MEEKKKVGRPKIEIDYDEVEKLANIQCTYKEIASFFGCSEDKLKRDEEFIHHFKKGFDGGKMSLRRTQFRLAETNTAMAIWLGKQYLGQRDVIQDISENKTQRIVIVNDLSDKNE